MVYFSIIRSFKSKDMFGVLSIVIEYNRPGYDI